MDMNGCESGEKMQFYELCEICAADPVLVDQFCRMHGIVRPEDRSDEQVEKDIATGYDAAWDFCMGFIEYVYYDIYLTMKILPGYTDLLE